MAADVLVTQGARASATMILTQFNRVNSVPARKGLRCIAVAPHMRHDVMKSLVTQFYIQRFFRTNHKEISKLRINDPLWLESIGDQWTPLQATSTSNAELEAFPFQNVIMSIVL